MDNNGKINRGIDLGTTNSAIAVMENGVPVIKKSSTQKDTIPSVVSASTRAILPPTNWPTRCSVPPRRGTVARLRQTSSRSSSARWVPSRSIVARTSRRTSPRSSSLQKLSRPLPLMQG